MKFKIIIALLLICFSTLGWYFNKSNSEDKDVLRLYGNIDIRQVKLSFHDSEHVETMLAKEGEHVKKGQQQVFAKRGSGSRPEDIHKA